MRIEKKESQINYWEAIDDGLAHPIIIGIEHRDGFLAGIQMSNPNTRKRITLTGVELEAVAMVFNESGFKVEQYSPEDANVV